MVISSTDIITVITPLPGDVENDEELNRAISPLYHVDSIRAPLVIAQGANDPRYVRITEYYKELLDPTVIGVLVIES